VSQLRLRSLMFNGAEGLTLPMGETSSRWPSIGPPTWPLARARATF